MARKQKWENNSEKPEFAGNLDDQGELYPPPDEMERPIATEKHRIVTEFVREREIDDLPIPSGSAKPQPQHIVPSSPVAYQPQDEVEIFLREISESTAGWELYVYRLPRYEIDNKTDPKSRTRVGKVPFSWDYELEIQRRWARPGESNHFVIVAKKDGQHVQNGTLPVFSCEPLPIEERISSGIDQLPPVQQPVATPVAAPYPAPIAEPVSIPTPKEQLKEALELVKMIQGISGVNVGNPAPAAAAPIDPELAVLQVLAKDETFSAKLSKGLLSKFFGDVKEEPDPWADVAKEALRSGQAGELLKVAISSIGETIRGFFPQQTVNAPAAAAQPQQPLPTAPPPEQSSPQELTPAEHLLSFVLEQCHRNAPREAVADQIFTFADQVNETDPLNSVDWYIRAFALMPPDDALAFVNQSVPGAERVTTQPHAKAWTTELQELLKQNYEGENDGNDQPRAENVG